MSEQKLREALAEAWAANQAVIDTPPGPEDYSAEAWHTTLQDAFMRIKGTPEAQDWQALDEASAGLRGAMAAELRASKGGAE